MSTRRRERGFVGMTEILTIFGVCAVLFAVLYGQMLGGPTGNSKGFIAATFGGAVVASLLSAFAAPVHPRYYDPGSLGCLALWIPQMLLIGGGGLGARAIASASGHGDISHWFSLAGAVAGAAIFLAGSRVAWRLLPPQKKDS